jgi:fructosamine-3-kinase
MNPTLKLSLENLIGEPVLSSKPVGGGDINHALCAETRAGSYFVKYNTASPPGMFEREAEGLAALARAQSLRTPTVVGIGEAEGIDFLVLEWIASARAEPETGRLFGRALAGLHRQTADEFGFDDDNFIGSLPQANCWTACWATFFGEHRIAAQLRLGEDSGRLPAALCSLGERLVERMPTLVPDELEPSLVHGDLWSGNYMVADGGQPVIIDPAVYYGHREVEIAFTQMFGGFPTGFYEGYDEAWPLDSGFASRRDLYNLYPLLVHANLFGGHYLSRCESVIRRYL